MLDRFIVNFRTPTHTHQRKKGKRKTTTQRRISRHNNPNRSLFHFTSLQRPVSIPALHTNNFSIRLNNASVRVKTFFKSPWVWKLGRLAVADRYNRETCLVGLVIIFFLFVWLFVFFMPERIFFQKKRTSSIKLQL